MIIQDLPPDAVSILRAMSFHNSRTPIRTRIGVRLRNIRRDSKSLSGQINPYLSI